MKTIRTTIITALLVAVATGTYAQRTSLKEKLFNRQDHQMAYFTADHNTYDNSRIENWMYDLRSWANNLVPREEYEAPVVTRTLFVENAEVIYEAGLELEDWMTESFDCSVNEEALSVESWMTEPFEFSSMEEDIPLESWMTEPFGSADYIEVESWMTGPWI